MDTDIIIELSHTIKEFLNYCIDMRYMEFEDRTTLLEELIYTSLSFASSGDMDAFNPIIDFLSNNNISKEEIMTDEFLYKYMEQSVIEMISILTGYKEIYNNINNLTVLNIFGNFAFIRI